MPKAVLAPRLLRQQAVSTMEPMQMSDSEAAVSACSLLRAPLFASAFWPAEL